MTKAPDKIHLTREGLAELKLELKEHKENKRPKAVERVARARDFGDLSENFEYHAAKNEQGLLEARIRTLRERLNRAVTVEHDTDEHVGVGSIVEIADEDDDGADFELRVLHGSDEGLDLYLWGFGGPDTVMAKLT